MPNIMTDETAQEIAREWQSPGLIGHVLATLASGIPVERDALKWDIERTIINDKPKGDDLVDLRDLQEWAERAESVLLVETDEEEEE